MTITSGGPRASTTAATPSAPATLGLADIIGEQALLLGAGSTVFNQLAMKGVGLGVAEHSTTLARPIDRLRTTLLYVYITVLGSEEERRTISRLVNKAHAPVRSQGRYTAFDPELQLWVAATLAHNALAISERVWGPLGHASRERIYQDAAVLGTALQVRPEQWPASLEEFAVYWEQQLERVEADPEVQVYVQRLLDTKAVPAPLRFLSPLQNLMDRGNLDPRVRAALGLTWTPRDQRRFDLFWRVFPPLYRLVPRRVRQLPAQLILRDTRRRLRAGGHVI